MPDLELITSTQKLRFVNYTLDENGRITSFDNLEVNGFSNTNFVLENLSTFWDNARILDGFVTKVSMSVYSSGGNFESDHNHIWFITPVLESESLLSVDYLKLTSAWFTVEELEDDNVTNPLYVSNNNICMYPDTIIKTDQGDVRIDELSVLKHTINNKKIRHVTRSYSHDVIRIEKNALGKNIPDKCTHMSGNHVIKYKGDPIEAKKLIHIVPSGISMINNSKSILYNILLDEYTFINANNTITETLHPSNLVARPIIKKYQKRKN